MLTKPDARETDAILKIAASSEWHIFSKLLESELTETHNVMSGETNIATLRMHQGRSQILRELLALPEQLRHGMDRAKNAVRREAF
jgi:hypothetical protein